MILLGYLRRLLPDERDLSGWPFWMAFWITSVLAAIGFASVFCWDWLAGGESASAVVRNLILSAVGLIGLPLALWRSSVAAGQLETSERSQSNERYHKGAAMLNGEKLSERLGGIYVLQKLAQDRPSEYHVEVMRLFCAFLRERRSLRLTFHDEETGEVRKISPLGHSDEEGFSILVEDEQAILDAFNSRDEAQSAVEAKDNYLLNLTELDFRKVRLHGIRFFNMDVSGTDFSGALLAGSRARNANFRKTIMSKANLGGSVFMSPEDWDPLTVPAPLILDGANLFDVSLEGAYLFGAKLNGARLEVASLVNAHLAGADLADANLSGTIVDGTSFSESPARLRHPATGLTQQQLDDTRPSAGKGPFLDGVNDAQTGKPLVWRNRDERRRL